MITHPSDDLANRSTIAFCQRLSAAKDETVKPAEVKAETAPKSNPFRSDCVTVFRINGTIEHYLAG